MLLAVKVEDLVERKQSIADAFLAAPLSAKEHDDKQAENSGGEEGGDEGESADKPPESVSAVHEFTQTEIDILQRLSERRQKLEEWQADLEVKENVLNLTQTKIDQKISELRKLKESVEKILAEYNTKEGDKIKSLVKIYESMKPKKAANIFSKLEHETLLPVMSRMKEAKVALILANMAPNDATKLTTEFAEYRRLPREGKK